jgi:hypothetical protein
MFERFTERARRVVFFARFEASQYGSPYIESEHLLLGLLREDIGLTKQLIPSFPALDQVRKEVEDKIRRGKQIPTTVEIPLSTDSKKALLLAAEESERLGSRYVGIEHFVLGLLRVGKCMAASILASHGANLPDLREKLVRQPLLYTDRIAAKPGYRAAVAFNAEDVLTRFFDQLRAGQPDEIKDLLAPEAQYIDPRGNRWAGKKELHDKMSELLAPFAARRAKYKVEDSIETNDGTQILTVFWEDVPLPDKEQIAILRMIVVLTEDEGGMFIYSMQITPIIRA